MEELHVKALAFGLVWLERSIGRSNIIGVYWLCTHNCRRHYRRFMGFIDAAIGGALIAIIYNWVARKQPDLNHHE